MELVKYSGLEKIISKVMETLPVLRS